MSTATIISLERNINISAQSPGYSSMSPEWQIFWAVTAIVIGIVIGVMITPKG